MWATAKTTVVLVLPLQNNKNNNKTHGKHLATHTDNKTIKSEPVRVHKDTRTRGREGSSKSGQDLMMPSNITDLAQRWPQMLAWLRFDSETIAFAILRNTKIIVVIVGTLQ